MTVRLKGVIANILAKSPEITRDERKSIIYELVVEKGDERGKSCQVDVY